MSQPIAQYEVTNPVEYFDLVLPSATPLPRRYELIVENLVSDRATVPAPDALTTMYFGFGDPVTYHEGSAYPHYNNTGMSNFAGEPNPTFGPPFPFKWPQTLMMGNRISIDTGSTVAQGTSGKITVYCPGTVSGNAVTPRYEMYGSRVHGDFYSDTLQPNGAPYFPGDAPGKLTHWTTPFSFAGTLAGVEGLIPTGFRFRNNGAGLEGFNFVAGRVELYAHGAGTQTGTPPPPPPPTQQPVAHIGDFQNGALVHDGATFKPAGQGGWTWAVTAAYLGAEWSVPWAPSTVSVYSSSNDGFCLATDSVSLSLYGSDTAPAHATDGTQIGFTQTITDSNGTYISWPAAHLPTTPYKHHWVSMTKAGAAASFYVSRIVYS